LNGLRRLLAGIPLTFSLACSLIFSGCLMRTHLLPPSAPAELHVASNQELIDLVNSRVARTQSLAHESSSGSQTNSSDRLRLLDVAAWKDSAMVPVLAFPLNHYEQNEETRAGLELPEKSQAVTLVPPEQSRITRAEVRSDAIQDVLFLRPLDTSREIVFSYEGVREPKSAGSSEPVYIIDCLRRDDQGWYLAHRIKISRITLSACEHSTFDRNGKVLLTAEYDRATEHRETLLPARLVLHLESKVYSIALA